MKKSIFILAAAVIVASCADVDSYREVNTQGNGEEVIGFASYTSKLTRAENSDEGYTWTFYTHQPSFKVYAYKNPNTAFDTQVFSGQVINAGANNAFTYDDEDEVRYWDKNVTTIYQFYAAAPADGGWVFKTDKIEGYSTQNKGYFTTESTLKGNNLRSGATDADHITALAEATSSFKAVDDIDKMIAAPCSGNYNNFLVPASNPAEHKVQFEFIHILSKMNVTVKKDDILDNKTVKLLSIEFFNIKNYGKFSEATAAVATGSYSRWSDQAKVQVNSADVTYKYENATGVELSKDDKIFFIESLIIPQPTETQTVDYDGTIPAIYYTGYEEYNTDKGTSLTEQEYNELADANKIKVAAAQVSGSSKPYFVISYTIDGELFTSYHNLASSFKVASKETLDFNEGWQNTLNINIKPEKIEFCADVANWDDNTDVADNKDVD